jgi:DNA-binding FadR family transcriptional regulator
MLLLTTMLEHISNAAAETATEIAPADVDHFAQQSERSRRALIAAVRDGEADVAEEVWRAHLDAERELLTEGSERALVDVFPSRTGKNAELVAGQLRRSIVTGELGEGDQVPPEALLTEQFGVSRPTLREAFRILESEGLLEVRRGARGGARIKLPTEDAVARYACLLLEYDRATVADVSAVRALLEPPCALAIGTRADRATLDKLADAVDAADAIIDPAARLHAQHGFHVLLVDLAGNRTISVLHAAIQQILEAATRRSTDVAGPAGEQAQHEGARSHRRLVELLHAGEAARAEQLWRRHLDGTTTFLERTGSALEVLALG